MMQYYPAGPSRLPWNQHQRSHGWEEVDGEIVFVERWRMDEDGNRWLGMPTEERIHWSRQGRKNEDMFYGMGLEQIRATLTAWWDEQGGAPPVWRCRNDLPYREEYRRRKSMPQCGGLIQFGTRVRCAGPCEDSRTFEQEAADVEAYSEARPHLHSPDGLKTTEHVRARWRITELLMRMREEPFLKMMSRRPSDFERLVRIVMEVRA